MVGCHAASDETYGYWTLSDFAGLIAVKPNCSMGVFERKIAVWIP